MSFDRSKKGYRFPPDGFLRLVLKPLGAMGCVVSDRITVHGEPVGYLYRQATNRPGDSGWSFLAGTESETELGSANFADVWTLNELANFDRRVIPLLESPIGSAFLTDELTGMLVLDPRGAPLEQ